MSLSDVDSQPVETLPKRGRSQVGIPIQPSSQPIQPIQTVQPIRPQNLQPSIEHAPMGRKRNRTIDLTTEEDVDSKASPSNPTLNSRSSSPAQNSPIPLRDSKHLKAFISEFEEKAHIGRHVSCLRSCFVLFCFVLCYVGS